MANKPDESLQGVIEKSAYWASRGKGCYELQYYPQPMINRIFGKGMTTSRREFGKEYIFSRSYKQHEFSITVDMDSHRLSPQVNGKDMTGGQANESLSKLGVQLPKSGTSQPRKVLNWILRDNDYRWEAKYSLLAPVVVQPGIASQETEISFQEADDEALFPEGREIYRLHRTKERNTSVVELAKRRAFQQDNLLRCEACGFSFTERYGELGRGFIEAHHTLPLSELTEQTMTRVEDLALVCSNCHKMLHKKRPWLRTPELKSILQVSQQGN